MRGLLTAHAVTAPKERPSGIHERPEHGEEEGGMSLRFHFQSCRYKWQQILHVNPDFYATPVHIPLTYQSPCPNRNSFRQMSSQLRSVPEHITAQQQQCASRKSLLAPPGASGIYIGVGYRAHSSTPHRKVNVVGLGLWRRFH
jgi:hypothetical protein